MSTHSKALEAARKYTLRGWHVIPVGLRSKRPLNRNWQNLLLGIDDLSEHFDEPQNVGVLLGTPSRELVDVDLDCDEAINLGDYFLPKTNRIHGRKSKRSSHYWYYAAFPKRMEKFNDLDGTTCLLEMRGTGHQTLVPPSVHPCGERLRWEVKGKVRRLRIKKLSRAVHKLAAAALLARHWPNAGCRNDAALALAGVLLRTGWSAEKASGFIGEVAREGGDEEWKARRRTVVATRRKLSSNLPTTGIPKLNALLGEPVVSKVLEWLNVKEEKANTENPAVELRSPKISPRPTLPFAQGEMLKILAATDSFIEKSAANGIENARRIRALVLLLRYTGMRICDVVSLSTDRVSHNRLFLYTQKTGVPVQTILPQFVIRCLQATPLKTDKYFFWSGTGKLDSAVRSWQARLKKLFRIAGVPSGHAHRFRDTFAVELLLAGVPIERVSILLGHRSVRITEKNYNPWVRSRQEQLEADIERALARDPVALIESKGTQKVRGENKVLN